MNLLPTHLSRTTIPALPPKGLKHANWFNELDWKGQIISSDGNRTFKLYYYGEVIYGSITSTNEAPPLIYAISTSSDERILVFDGAIHGYEALFGEIWEKTILDNREASNTYIDEDGESEFELIAWANYGIDFDEERDSYIRGNKDGMVKLINGLIAPFDQIRQEGFDAFGVLAVSSNGRVTPAVELELA